MTYLVLLLQIHIFIIHEYVYDLHARSFVSYFRLSVRV